MAVRASSRRGTEPARRSAAVWLRAAEAASYLTAASLAIRFVPFRRLVPVFTRALPGTEVTGPARTRAIADVRRAVLGAAARLPNRPVCFPRAVAAQAMLRRRGVVTSLRYGVNTSPDRGLNAHVWLTAGDEGVIGQETAAQFPQLAVYSNAAAHSSVDLVSKP